MKIGLLTLGVCASLCLSAPALAQVSWTATTSPIITSLAGGPWLLQQGGPYTEVSGTTTVGGPYDGTVPYCTPGGASGGTPIANTPAGQMQPFYFPFVTGRGLSLQGFFDYRPRDITEAVVAAASTDGGQTWTFQQQVENLNTVCPQSDANGTNGNENGEGHPNIILYGGGHILYLLDRRNGHADFDGLVMHYLTPKVALPLYGLSSMTEFGPPTVTASHSPATPGIITQWQFPTGVGTNTYPLPNIGSGTANPLGMNNSYGYPVGCNPPGTSCTLFTGSTNSEDITSTTGGADQSYSAKAWRIRGPGGNTGGATGNGWNTQAPQYTQGAQFLVSTVGYYNIVFQYDWYATAQGPRNLQAQYTTDGSTWTNVGPLYVAPGGDAYYPQIVINFAALGIHTVDNNTHFGIQLVSAYDPTFVGSGTPCPTTACTYTAAKLTAGAPTQLNNTSGNWRFDEINVLGTPALTPNNLTLPTNTTGLTNPDGILASVPGYPFKILYVSKTLNGDYALPTNQQCGASPTSGKTNHDFVQVRIATSTDGIHWTDQGAVAGLNDPTTVSYSGIRYAAPNGTLLKLSTGNWGVFFGGGNCLDGDSDSFHAILYAESSNLTSWTVVNGINNPIASVSTVTATDPVTLQSVTIPANAPVVGATQDWFSGRVYGPQAAPATTSNSSLVNLVFSGYNSTYSADISDYRTIGQVQLSTGGGVTIP